jgi:prephenate dehydrogenase
MALKTFGIIGYGAFGELMSRLLSQHAKVVISSRRDIPEYDLPNNVSVGSVAEAARCDVVVLCNELSTLTSDCKKIAKHVKPSTIVMDVCSVKLLPAQIMKKILGDRCRIVATHPLFGPQSVSKVDGHGKKIVWHEVEGGPFDELEEFVRAKLGLEIIKMSPESHDKQMAWVHCLTFFVGRGLVELNPPESELATNYYDRLQSIVNIEKQHSYELFRTVQLGNIYSGQIRKEFMQRLQEIDELLREDHI